MGCGAMDVLKGFFAVLLGLGRFGCYFFLSFSFSVNFVLCLVVWTLCIALVEYKYRSGCGGHSMCRMLVKGSRIYCAGAGLG